MGGQKGIALFYNFFCRHVQLTIASVKKNDAAYGGEYKLEKVFSNNASRYINPFYFFTLRKIIRNKKISHLILEHPYYGWLAFLLKRSTGVKLIIHSHNIEGLRFKSTGRWWAGILWRYEKWVHRKADLNFFIQDDDRDYAITNFKLDEKKCVTITYGFEMTQPPSPEEKLVAKNAIRTMYKIDEHKKILLFNGTLSYKPNSDALDSILQQINPVLMQQEFKYCIIICGKGLSADYEALKNYEDKHIIYAGFVDDIDIYFKAADIFINPVIDGGGIKTKLVEALGYNLAVVTTKSSTTGIPELITNGKMKVIADNDWNSFAMETIATDSNKNIGQGFFEHFYWGNIAKKAFESIIKQSN